MSSNPSGVETPHPPIPTHHPPPSVRPPMHFSFLLTGYRFGFPHIHRIPSLLMRASRGRYVSGFAVNVHFGPNQPNFCRDMIYWMLSCQICPTFCHHCGVNTGGQVVDTAALGAPHMSRSAGGPGPTARRRWLQYQPLNKTREDQSQHQKTPRSF